MAGNYDTTYDKRTVLLNEAECWDLVRKQKCAENTMIRESSTNGNDTGELITKESAPYNLTDQIKEALVPLHQQFIEGLAISHEKKLVHEIRDVYCQVLKNEFNLTILKAQTNGLLAADALGLQPCSRIEGFGKTLLLSTCSLAQVELLAQETKLITYNQKKFTTGRA